MHARRSTRNSRKKSGGRASTASRTSTSRLSIHSVKPRQPTDGVQQAALRRQPSRSRLAGGATFATPEASTRTLIFQNVAVTPFTAKFDRGIGHYDASKEPIKTFLRVRPPPLEDDGRLASRSYVSIKNEQEITMEAPSEMRLKSRTPRPPATYLFTKVFPLEFSQHDVFASSTKPLIKEMLTGENDACVFTYGITNSGKSYTVQGRIPRNVESANNSVNGGGGSSSRATPTLPTVAEYSESGKENDECGILPRALEVVLKSTEGAQSTWKIRPLRFDEVEEYVGNEPTIPNVFTSGVESLDEKPVDVSSKCGYAVWVSYAEIYNEQVYDLLDPSVAAWNARNGTKMAPPKRAGLRIRKDQLSDNFYLQGITEYRIRTMQEAWTVLMAGARSRSVYSTTLNAESSRSHSIFTIKVLKIPNDYSYHQDLSSVVTRRISIVDLAGSESAKKTMNVGARLREATQINKSLMTLEQCMEVMRFNQLNADSVKPVLVPYRQSKLTELFQSAFTGGCKTVMIVNINPYDASYEATSRVLRFAALARDVAVTQTPAASTARKLFKHSMLAYPPRPGTALGHIKNHGGHSGDGDDMYEDEDYDIPGRGTKRRKSALDGLMEKTASGNPFGRPEDVDDDETVGASGDVEGDGLDFTFGVESNMFIRMLYESISNFRNMWAEAEKRCATLESEIRREITTEYNAKIKELEKLYQDRLANEIYMNEEKVEKKIDIMTRSQLKAEKPSSTSHAEVYAEYENMIAQLKSHITLLKSQASDRDSRITRLGDELASLKLKKQQLPPRLIPSPTNEDNPAKDGAEGPLKGQIADLNKALEETRGRMQAEQMVSYTLRRRVNTLENDLRQCKELRMQYELKLATLNDEWMVRYKALQNSHDDIQSQVNESRLEKLQFVRRLAALDSKLFSTRQQLRSMGASVPDDDNDGGENESPAASISESRQAGELQLLKEQNRILVGQINMMHEKYASNANYNPATPRMPKTFHHSDGSSSARSLNKQDFIRRNILGKPVLRYDEYTAEITEAGEDGRSELSGAGAAKTTTTLVKGAVKATQSGGINVVFTEYDIRPSTSTRPGSFEVVSSNDKPHVVPSSASVVSQRTHASSSTIQTVDGVPAPLQQQHGARHPPSSPVLRSLVPASNGTPLKSVTQKLLGINNQHEAAAAARDSPARRMLSPFLQRARDQILGNKKEQPQDQQGAEHDVEERRSEEEDVDAPEAREVPGSPSPTPPPPSPPRRGRRAAAVRAQQKIGEANGHVVVASSQANDKTKRKRKLRSKKSVVANEAEAQEDAIVPHRTPAPMTVQERLMSPIRRLRNRHQH